MPTQPETLPRRRLCAAGPERVFVHMVTPQDLRCVLLEKAVNTRRPVRDDGHPAQ